MRRILYTFLILTTVATLQADDDNPAKGGWFTGPLVANTATVTAPGKIQIEPYFLYEMDTAQYGPNWGHQSAPYFLSMNPYFIIWFGIAKNLDFRIDAQMFINHTRSHEYTGLGDTIAGFDYMLHQQTTKNLWPSIVLSLKEIFPSGRYQRLNPNGHGVDSVGSGAFGTRIGLYLERTFKVCNERLLNLIADLIYVPYCNTNVNDFNAYGGGYKTQGTVDPGAKLNAIFSFELQMTQEVVLACDFVYKHVDRSTFSGSVGHTATGALATVGEASSEVFSIAPALEYNFNDHAGLVGGVWFSVAGRNTSIFCTPTIAFDYTY